MAKRRRDRGEGGYDPLPSGNFQFRLPGPKRAGSTRTFASKAEGFAWLAANKLSPRGTHAGTLGEWLAEWLALRKPDLASKSYQHDELRVRTVLVPRLGDVKLRDLDPTRVQQLLADLAAEGQGADFRHKVGKVLRSALNSAVEHKRLAVAPRIRLSKPKPATKRILSVEEIARLLAAADALGIGHVYRLWIDTGMRPQELFALLWDDFDAKTGRVRISKALDSLDHVVKATKTDLSRRTLPLAASTVAALVAARPAIHKGKLLVPDETGAHFWVENFRRGPWARLMKRAELAGTGVIYYTFRHTMATHLLSRGVNPLIVSRRLGHSNVATVYQHYAEVLPDDQDRAAGVMGEVMGENSPRSPHAEK